jgi:hypothetical protein
MHMRLSMLPPEARAIAPGGEQDVRITLVR